MKRRRTQTVAHVWPDGQRWVPCPGGMVPLHANGRPNVKGAVRLKNYRPPPGADWEVIPWRPLDKTRRDYQVWRCTVDGLVSCAGVYASREDAEAVAECLNAGRDGFVAGCRYAKYLVVYQTW